MWTFVYWVFVGSIVVLFAVLPVLAALWGAAAAFRRWVR